MINHELILNDISKFDMVGFLKSGALMAVSDRFIMVGAFPRASALQPTDSPCLYAPDFFLKDEKPWFEFDQVFLLEKASFKELLSDHAFADWDVERETKPSKELFETSFDRIVAGFASGRFEKVVPYSVAYLEASTGPKQVARALARLMDLPGQFVPYGLWDETSGILGATPELLFEKNGDEVASMAIAGTIKLGSTKKPLIEDDKQLLEHQVVVDSVEAVLKKFGDVTTQPLGVKTLLYLEHLCTKISVILKEEVSFEQLVHSLHPTPALGANPHGSADDLFEELDVSLPRGRFGAPFGWCKGDGDGICTVAIRNAQWTGNKIALAAGCGVVPASHLEDEWAELQAKLESIRKILGL